MPLHKNAFKPSTARRNGNVSNATVLPNTLLHCEYKYFRTKRTREAAEEDCVSQGMHLATICTADEAISARGTAGTSDFWFGLKRVAVVSKYSVGYQWVWADDSTCSFILFKALMKKFTMGFGAEATQCAIVTGIDTMVIKSCSELNSYVCSKCMQTSAASNSKGGLLLVLIMVSCILGLTVVTSLLGYCFCYRPRHQATVVHVDFEPTSNTDFDPKSTPCPGSNSVLSDNLNMAPATFSWDR